MSPDCCVAPALLNRLTGLEDKVKVHQAGALDMPLSDASLDAKGHGTQQIYPRVSTVPEYFQFHLIIDGDHSGDACSDLGCPK